MRLGVKRRTLEPMRCGRRDNRPRRSPVKRQLLRPRRPGIRDRLPSVLRKPILWLQRAYAHYIQSWVTRILRPPA
jgi:hypothetical protein